MGTAGQLLVHIIPAAVAGMGPRLSLSGRGYHWLYTRTLLNFGGRVCGHPHLLSTRQKQA